MNALHKLTIETHRNVPLSSRHKGQLMMLGAVEAEMTKLGAA